MTESVLPPGCLRTHHCFENTCKGMTVLNSQGLTQHCPSAVLLSVHLLWLSGNNILETNPSLGLSCLFLVGWMLLAGRVVLPETGVLWLPGVKRVPRLEDLCLVLPVLGMGLAAILSKVVSQVIHLFLKPSGGLGQEKVDKGITQGTPTGVTQFDSPVPRLISGLPGADVPYCGHSPGSSCRCCLAWWFMSFFFQTLQGNTVKNKFSSLFCFGNCRMRHLGHILGHSMRVL